MTVYSSSHFLNLVTEECSLHKGSIVCHDNGAWFLHSASKGTLCIREAALDNESTEKIIAQSLYQYAEQKEAEGKIDKAIIEYHRSYLCGSANARSALTKCQAQLLSPMRRLYPGIFIEIDKGEPLRALNLLRMAAAGEHRYLLGPVLAYCLRGANCPKEGVELCYDLLDYDPIQDDVYGHLCSFLIELELDEEAFNIAKRHLEFFPTSALAWKNACDCSLLTKNKEQALLYLQGYLVFSESENLCFKKLFTTFDELEELQEAAQLLCHYGNALLRPNPENLALLGEVLINIGDLEKAFLTFEKSIRAAPENISTLFAYSRALAKNSRWDEAVKLLLSRQIINHPRISNHHQVEYVTILSACYEDLGISKESWKLWQKLRIDIETLITHHGTVPAGAYLRAYVDEFNQLPPEAEKLLFTYPALREFL